MQFYINTITQEVHESSCEKRPTMNESYLGMFDSASQAVDMAKTCGYYDADGCANCCLDANTK
jgi:hypothetical protein